MWNKDVACELAFNEDNLKAVMDKYNQEGQQLRGSNIIGLEDYLRLCTDLNMSVTQDEAM